MEQERTALARYRLESDLGYVELAAQLGKSLSWVHQFLTSDEPRANDRSLYRVRAFLEERKLIKRSKRTAA